MGQSYGFRASRVMHIQIASTRVWSYGLQGNHSIKPYLEAEGLSKSFAYWVKSLEHQSPVGMFWLRVSNVMLYLPS